MTRHHRITDPHSFFHIYTRGNRRQDIFLAPTECLSFLGDIAELKQAHSLSIQAYCLMPNHFHLLIQDREGNLSVFMHRLLTRLVGRFNRLHGYHGHVLQGRFHAKVCRNDIYARVVARYIDLNPVRSGFVESPSLWPWGGFSELGGDGARDILHREFYERHFDGVAAFQSFVLSKVNAKVSTDNISEAANLLGLEPGDYQDPNWKRLERIAVELESKALMTEGVLRRSNRNRRLTPLRREFSRSAAQFGIPTREIARFLGCSRAAVGKLLKLQGE